MVTGCFGRPVIVLIKRMYVQLAPGPEAFFFKDDHPSSYKEFRAVGLIFVLRFYIHAFHRTVRLPLGGMVKKSLVDADILEFTHIDLQRKIVYLSVGPSFCSCEDIVEAIIFGDGIGKIDGIGKGRIRISFDGVGGSPDDRGFLPKISILQLFKRIC